MQFIQFAMPQAATAGIVVPVTAPGPGVAPDGPVGPGDGDPAGGPVGPGDDPVGPGGAVAGGGLAMQVFVVDT